MIPFLITAHYDDEFDKYVVYAESEYQASCKAHETIGENYGINLIESEEFNTFEHGDIRDYPGL